MYYFRGLIDSINLVYNFKTHFPARQYIFNPTFYNFLCKWSEVSDIPFYRSIDFCTQKNQLDDSWFLLYLQNYIHVDISLRFILPAILGQALTRLVTVSSMCCHTSTSALSTSSSSRGFTSFEWDISS